MSLQKFAEALLKRARENGSKINKVIVDDTEVEKRLEPSIVRNYARALKLWET